MPRPNQIRPRGPLADDDIGRAVYVGSAEHKVVRWWSGMPAAYAPPGGVAQRPGKQDTTICPLVTAADRDTATDWVRTALRAGQLRWYEGDKDFPKRLWYRDCQGRYWTGFCVNGVLGQYKGWPFDEDEKIEIFG